MIFKIVFGIKIEQVTIRDMAWNKDRKAKNT